MYTIIIDSEFPSVTPNCRVADILISVTMIFMLTIPNCK